MRIGIFTNTYWPSQNGVAVSIANLREGLERLGHEPYVFAPGSPELIGLEDHPGVIRFPYFIPPNKPDYPIALPSPKTFRQINELELDVVHAHHPWWVGKWGIWHAVKEDVTSILTRHTQYGLYADYVPLLPGPVSKSLMELGLIRSCQLVDLVTTPGFGSMQQLLDLGIKTPIELVSNPNKLDDFVGASGESVRRQYGIRQNEVLLGYVGRLSEEKNLRVLIEAFGFVAKQRSDVRLMIVGKGTDRDELESMAEQVAPGRVIFTGPIEHCLIAPYFAAFDLFVTPSKSEVQPMSFAEAFAGATPIVAFDVPGCNDMVKPNESGVLVSLEEGARGLATAILRLIASMPALMSLGFRARDWATQYEQMAAVRRMLEVYEQAIDLH